MPISGQPDDAGSADPGNPGHAPSWYAATARDQRIRPPLSGEAEADVCVIGAGFTGVSAALDLAERGFRVVVLEAERIGFGASGRNGGQIVNGYSRDLDEIARRYGADKARALGAMALEGGQIIRDRVARYGIDCDLRQGNFFAAFSGRQMRELVAAVATWQRYGHDGLEMVGRDGIARYIDTDRYVGGLADHHGGHVHPLNLVLGEAAAAEGQGARIHERSRVTGVDTGTAPVVLTDGGLVRCRYVLVCCNAYIGRLLPQIGRGMMPVSSQVMATEPLEAERVRALLPADYCIEDTNYILDYYRRTADNRLLYGGGTSYGGRDPADIVGLLRPKMLATFPALADVRIDHTWSGNFALTFTRIPHVGRLTDNIYFSHGDSGHGVTTTHLLGRILGEAVAGHAGRFDVWASLRNIPFPGGRVLRIPLTVAGAWWYGLRDRLGV